MTPDQATRYVESLDLFGMRFGVERMRALLDILGRPQHRVPAVHVVGTNGKTSTTRFVAAIHRAQALRSGAYVSPHVTGWNERILIDDQPIDPDAFASAVKRVQIAAARVGTTADPVTQFEVLTAAAFVAFADADVDVIAVEAGLGGRFDATNVFDGRATVALTGIALEHTDLLGDSERAIAEEKLAVVPDGGRVIVGRVTGAAEAAVNDVCTSRSIVAERVDAEILVREQDGAVTVTTGRATYTDIRPAMHASMNASNLAVAVAAAEQLRGRALDPRAVRAGLAELRVPGRLEVIDGAPRLVMDGAHNPDGMRALADALGTADRERTVAVVSVFADKDIDQIAKLLSRVSARAVATRSGSPRSAPAPLVAAALAAAGVVSRAIDDPLQALTAARGDAGPDGTVLICGSLALLAQIRNAARQVWSDGAGMLAAGNIPEIDRNPER